MAMPLGPAKRPLLVLLLVLAVLAGALAFGFRVRDQQQQECTSDKCPTPSGRARRGFETVSVARGSFAKKPPDEPEQEQQQVPAAKKAPATSSGKLWSKLPKIDLSQEVEDDDTEDDAEEDVQIEVEDEDSAAASREESAAEDEDSKVADDESQVEESEEDEKELEELRKKKEKEEEERHKREEEVRRKREEAEKLLIEEAERRLKEEQERQRLEEEEEERLKLEAERKLKEEEELKKKALEEAERKRKEEEKKKLEEAERKRKEEERRKLEEAEKKRKEEIRKKIEEEKKRKLEEAERKKKEEERKRLEEERKKKEEAERKKKELEEAERKRKEAEEAERKKKEAEEAEKKKRELEEAERKKKELEEAERKKKEEEAKKEEVEEDDEDEDADTEEDIERRKKIMEEEDNDDECAEDQELEKKRDAEEDRKRIARVKKEAEERSKKKKPEPEGSDESEDEDENENEDEVKDEKVKEEDDDEEKQDDETDEEDDDEDEQEEEEKDASEPAEELYVSDEKPEPKKLKPKKADSSGTSSGTSSSHVPVSLAELNDMILSVPTFVPNFTAVENPECQRQGEIFLRQLRGFKLWALQMLDSSAKIPSGLLRGNVNQLGDFDQCLEVAARVSLGDDATATLRMHGKYCLAQVDLHPLRSDAQLPVNLIQSRALIRGNLSDPGHFVPKFTTANWGLCLPAACTAEDARVAVEEALNPYNESIGIRFSVHVDPDMCYVKRTKPSYSKETVAVLYFYAMFVCLSVVATIRDYIFKLQDKGSYSERIIMSFSLKRTVKALFGRSETSSSDIGCIHGIRSIATVALYVAHKLIPVSSLPYANRATLTETATNPLSLILRASLFYTDSFLLLSGVLTAYNMAKELSDRGEIRWLPRFVARYIRLTPALLAVVLWYAYVMEHIGTGPQWNAVVKRNADICKSGAWINLFYVQNHLPFEEMCATHTHQLALDMQMSLIAPVLVFFLQMKPLLGIVLVFFLLQVSATLRYFATSSNNLSLIIFHGMTIQELYKTANLTYTSPVHRATPYLFGVCLGVILRYTGKNVRLYKILALLGWLIAGALGMWSLFSPWQLARRDYEYDVEEATHYAVISPILTALALCWTIFACFTDNGGIINKILSSHWMVVFSKLSYSIYLTQFAVFFYNVGSVRYSSEFQILKILDPIEAVIVVLVSIVLTLIFDIPMQEAKNIVMECGDPRAIEEKSKTVIEEPEVQDLTSTQLPPIDKKNLKKLLRRSSTADISVDDYEDEEEDESETGNWNWNRGTFTKSEPREFMENGYDEPYRNPRYRRLDRRRMTMVRSEALYGDDWEYRGGSRRASRSEDHSMDEDRSYRNGRRYSNSGMEDDRPSRNGHRYSSSGLDDDRPSRNGYRYSNPALEDDRASRNGYRYSNSELEDEGYFQPRERYSSNNYTRSPMRDLNAPVLRRSYSRERYTPKEPEPDRRDYRRPLITISKEDDYQTRSARSSAPRFAETQRSISSEGEPDLRRGPNYRRGSSAEPRIASDEDEWEEEIKLRRSRFERVSSQERERVPPAVVEEEDEWNTLRRRSSAEGKIALLKEPIRGGNMELWTVSKIALGSSQEPDDEDFDESIFSRRDYREQGPPLREEFEEDEEQKDDERKNSLATTSLPTSFEEEEESNGHDLGLKRENKMITIQDLSKLSQIEDDMTEEKEWNKLDVKTGLFKRESIIKSQASEEDPEYLIPERPKLVEQEQEHPFKKAWQLQKSRSEEEGPSGFIVKDAKSTGTTLEKQREEPEEKREDEGAQYEEFCSPDVSCEVTFVWQARSQEVDNNSRSRSSSLSSRQDEVESYYDDYRNRRQSQEENWTWTERDT